MTGSASFKLIFVAFLGVAVGVTAGLKCYQCSYNGIDRSDATSNRTGCVDDPIKPEYLLECEGPDIHVYCTTSLSQRINFGGNPVWYHISRACASAGIGCRIGDDGDPPGLRRYVETCHCDTDDINNVPRP